MDNPEPRAQYLNVVLRLIERTSLRIPRFQRHFVWGEKEVIDLMGSIQKGYPIGSVLTWKVEASDEYFSGFRELPFPPADEAMRSFEVILDGAQRLSSLYGCLKDPSSDPVYRVFYDLRTRQFQHRTELHHVQAWHLPMDTLFDSRKFLAIQSAIADLEDGEELLPRALDLYSTFQDYQVPIIALSNAALEDVVEVFRRINSSGTPLSSVDFVRALTWRSSFDLEETFEDFEERYQGTPLEGLTEDFLVRCLSIASELSLDTRDVIQLKALSNREGGLGSEVESMTAALDEVAQFIGHIGIAGVHEIPYEIQRLLLFAMKHADVDVAEDELERWFWKSTFAEEHQGKPESYTSRLVRELRHGNVAPALEVRKSVDPLLFADRVRRAGSAVALGFDLLMRKSAVRSLLSGTEISGAEALHGILFSRQELELAGMDGVKSPSYLANLVLLSREDAAEWKTLRSTHSLSDIYVLAATRYADADLVWENQAVLVGLEEEPILALRTRSQALLARVVKFG
ncbi:DUF262 domain-containing protein [Curtobacterium sp. MCLR17_044]|uniref:DUF262 domain-containing protein n=1 Tax=Curtobacterium sp. MCLR17_044 TaxID=2175628 RepID=UPI000DA969F3|nr:DUF262 domain-containing protein [Curtobacterium sp. MCLR17_044]PZE55700.1 hypothetical protein DEJ04_14135 [Curtobacterium sp. MCLR17_044]